MNKKLLSIFLILMLAASAFALTACGGNDDEGAGGGGSYSTEDTGADYDDPALANEEDGAEPVSMPHDEKDFVGKWSATSEHAQFLFGNVDLKINEDGSWTGNITEEDFHGKWKYDGTGIIIKSSDKLINYSLFFVTDGSLMFNDNDDPDMTPLVLKKQ